MDAALGGQPAGPARGRGRALPIPAYYRGCWSRTRELRAQLAADLRAVDGAVTVDEAVANFLS